METDRSKDDENKQDIQGSHRVINYNLYWQLKCHNMPDGNTIKERKIHDFQLEVTES